MPLTSKNENPLPPTAGQSQKSVGLEGMVGCPLAELQGCVRCPGSVGWCCGGSPAVFCSTPQVPHKSQGCGLPSVFLTQSSSSFALLYSEAM